MNPAGGACGQVGLKLPGTGESDIIEMITRLLSKICDLHSEIEKCPYEGD
jgi:hypothetical protein